MNPHHKWTSVDIALYIAEAKRKDMAGAEDHQMPKPNTGDANMKPAIALIALAALTACTATPEMIKAQKNRCTQLGYTPGTPEILMTGKIIARQKNSCAAREHMLEQRCL